MFRFHVIAGLPRAGSTLLCNLLNQNPHFHASSTSVVSPALIHAASFISNSDELKSELSHDRIRTEKRFVGLLRGMIDGWYSVIDKDVIFDKSRAWNHNAATLQSIYPNAKLIVMVRDLRSIFASIERQHLKAPYLSHMVGNYATSIASRATTMFNRQSGIIGSALSGIEDILRRKPANVIFIKYETFVGSPNVVLSKIYANLNELSFEHNLDNVESTTIELDALWLNKFPHEGNGAVVRSEEQWEKWLSYDLAHEIMQQFAGYNEVFGYQ